MKQLWYGKVQWEADWLPIIASQAGIVALGCLGDSIEDLQNQLNRYGQWQWQSDKGELASYQKELSAYFNGDLSSFTVDYDWLGGTDFQRLVWTQLMAIPYGQTWSYQDVANAIGRPTAVRAVANAIGRNPLPIIVPCHRVIASNGSIGGYSGGLGMKRRLMAIEGIVVK